MTDWLTPDLKRSIAHGETRRLTWPANKPCPVEKGDRFEIRKWLTIEIEKISRRIPKGKPAEWQAEFIRHEADRPQLLRRTPSGLPLQPHEMTGLTEIERARRDGNYTSAPGLALIDEPESVGPDWHDPGVAEREQTRQQAREDQEMERQLRDARRRLTDLTRGLDPAGQQHLLTELIRVIEALESRRMVA